MNLSLRGRIEAVEADITTLLVDAIVNATNAALTPGGGVDGTIRHKAGQQINDDLRAIGGCEPGNAVITPGYDLPAQYVIHTVAPIWAGPAKAKEQQAGLAHCYEMALELADANAIRTIAFPAIGTGAYRWPADIAARIAFETVAAHLRRCEQQTLVTFCCYVRADRERYDAMIARLSE